MPTDLVVVHCPVGGGHKAAALAVAEAAGERGLSVEVVDAFQHAPRWAGDAYLAAHLAGQSAAPDLYGDMYFATNRRGALDPVRLRFDALVFRGLVERVKELAPRAIVATHHLPLVVLGRERRKDRVHAPLVGVVTDYIAHACWAERGVDAWALPTMSTREQMSAHGVDASRAAITGIPVRAAFERIALLSARRSGPLRVLVTSGGFGVGPVARVVASFAGVRDVELTIVCGAAERVAEQARRAAARAGVRARVIGFERDMPARVAQADVIVGKAGGLTVTEAMTAGRAMVIASAVPGNEAVNERLLVAAGAGVSTSPDGVGPIVDALRDRGRLPAMGRRARGLVPRGAANAVVELALSAARRAVVVRAA